MGEIDKRRAISERHHALDLIRGIAALAVANYHFLSWNVGLKIQSMGTFSVYVFFILSGLTMLMVYGSRFRSGIAPESCASFFRNRIARLLPLLICVSLVVVVETHFDSGVIGRAVLTGTGLFSLGMPGFLGSSTGTWSLGIEALFYTVFPVAAMAAMRASTKVLILTTIGLLVAKHIFLWLLQPMIGNEKVFWDYYSEPITFAPFFAIGFIIYRIGGSRLNQFTPVGLGCLAVLMSFSLMVDDNLFSDQPMYFALTILAAFTIYCFYRSRLPTWMIGIAMFLGDISYSLYLTHWIVDWFVNKICDAAQWSLGVQWAMFLVTAVTVASISYRWLETTAREWIRASAKPPLQMARTDLP